MSFNKKLQLIKKAYSDVSFKNKEDELYGVNIYNIFDHYNIPLNKNTFKAAINIARDFEPKNLNDYYYISTLAVIDSKGLKKVAYPNMMGALTEEVEPEFDLEKWSSIVYKINDLITNYDMSYDEAVEECTKYLDSETNEDEKFKKWLKYYKDGEHLKYNVASARSDKMEKKGFQFPLNQSGFYPDYTTIPSQSKKIKNLKKDDKKEEFSTWKQKLYAAIRRIDKLLRQGDPYLDEQIHADLADLLHAFDMEVRKVRSHVTASDLTYRTVNNFRKVGFDAGADLLEKVAQEAPAPDDVTPDIGNVGPSEEVLDVNEQPAQTNVSQVPTSEGRKGIGDALRGGTGPRPGEYEQLASDITLDEAAAKLEEIAGRLADRRVVRLLAEFDIMLDKLGIASMFPELAEAQSKLIDSYSYSLTRVTKMLGMLSSGKSIAEISDAKEGEIQKGVDKEVGKTFQAGEENKQKGTEAISEEFGGQAGQPEEGPVPAAPQATPNTEV